MSDLLWQVMIGTLGIMTLVVGFIVSLFYRERERRRHEREKFSLTEENERRYRDLFDNVTDLIYLHTPEGEITDINRTLVEQLGFRVDEIKGHRIEEFILPQDRSRLRDYLHNAANGNRVIEGLLPIRSKNGEKLHVLEYRSSPVISHGHPFAIRGVARDVTDRVRYERLRVRDERRMRMLLRNSEEMQTALTHLTREMMMIQERERESISRELHDEIGQMIAAITMNLERIRADVASRKRSLLRRIESTQDLTSSILQRIREVLRDLRPLGLEPLGIIPAVERLAHDFRERSGSRIEVSGDPKAEEIPIEQKIVLYRVVQESLTNAWRHGHAKCVAVSIRWAHERVEVEVRDDGVGFEVGPGDLAKNSPTGLGLLGMRERVKFFDGDFSVRSNPGEGTTVLVSLPLKR